MSEIKSKGDRLKETIRILKKLPEVGVPKDSYSYSQVQELMTTWVEGGGRVSETLDFVSHWAEIVLPIRYDQTASLHLKAKHK